MSHTALSLTIPDLLNVIEGRGIDTLSPPLAFSSASTETVSQPLTTNHKGMRPVKLPVLHTQIPPLLCGSYLLLRC